MIWVFMVFTIKYGFSYDFPTQQACLTTQKAFIAQWSNEFNRPVTICVPKEIK